MSCEVILSYEPRHEKNLFRGFQLGPTHTGLSMNMVSDLGSREILLAI